MAAEETNPPKPLPKARALPPAGGNAEYRGRDFYLGNVRWATPVCARSRL